jgi:hypothetical protein
LVCLRGCNWDDTREASFAVNWYQKGRLNVG